jgi:membrane fusion protein, multidrug efflux system
VRSNRSVSGSTNHFRARVGAAACFVMVVSVTGCTARNEAAQTDKSATTAGGPPTIEVVRVVQRPLDVTLSMPGQLDPYESVAVSPKITGFVKTIRVDRGSRVKAGEVIAQLEAPELVAQRAEAQSKVQSAQAQLGAVRSKADADASTLDKLKAAAATPGVVAGNDLVVAQKAVEADQNQVTSAQQAVEAARQSLQAITQLEDYLRVTAPIDGVVTERNVHPGTLVGPNSGPAAATPIVRVVQTDRLRLVVPVPEAYTAGISIGSTMTFDVAAYPGQAFSGTVARIAEEVDLKTRTMAVELDVTNKDGKLNPGAYCRVKWPVRRPTPSLLVPTGSIASTTDRTFVIRIRNGKTEWVDVTTGLASGASTEVFGDLKAGEEIAVRGTDEIKSGTEVRTKAITPSA